MSRNNKFTISMFIISALAFLVSTGLRRHQEQIEARERAVQMERDAAKAEAIKLYRELKYCTGFPKYPDPKTARLETEKVFDLKTRTIEEDLRKAKLTWESINSFGGPEIKELERSCIVNNVFLWLGENLKKDGWKVEYNKK